MATAEEQARWKEVQEAFAARYKPPVELPQPPLSEAEKWLASYLHEWKLGCLVNGECGPRDHWEKAFGLAMVLRGIMA
jgi:hypothetical protein